MSQNVFWILLSAMIINNFTLMMFLGLCPFMGVSAKIGTALRMGMANIFVLTITSVCAWALDKWVLPHAEYLRLISFIVVIASMVQITEMAIKKLSPALFRQLGIFLPLITTNCAILGMALWQTQKYGYGLVQGLFYAIGAGLGLTLALVLMASIRENTELSDVPSIAKGTALTLIIAGSLSLAFMGFSGLGERVMGQIAAIGVVALLFAAFALLHRRVEPRGCSDANADACEGCSHHSDCLENREDVR